MTKATRKLTCYNGPYDASIKQSNASSTAIVRNNSFAADSPGHETDNVEQILFQNTDSSRSDDKHYKSNWSSSSSEIELVRWSNTLEW